MRLHSLTVEAFGPYADRQDVDFDELNDAGVFLLTGPTGAGKTSVLDAVCFALYGVVPGDREVRGLRSAHAAPDVPTRVELELTLCGRRLRVERWPEWERPKKRGTGTTHERAGARLHEVGADGSERLVSSRVQEVGHELGPLLGMTSEQFKQVVLLPQGGFSAFLKADSDQRRDVLERLFATQRFTRIEGWVQDRAARLRRRAEAARAELSELLTAMGHRAGRARPDDLDEPALQRWRADVLAQASLAVEATATAERAARQRLEQAQQREQLLTQRHALLRRRSQAEADLRALMESAQEAEQGERRLRDHRRAATVTPLLEPLREAESRCTEALARVERTTGGLDAPLDREGCDRAVAEVLRRLGELEGLEPLVARLDDARRRATALRAELTDVAAEVERLRRDSETLPEQREALVARLEEARRAGSRVPDLEGRLREAVQRRTAAESVPAARRRVEASEAEARSAHEHHNEALAAHLELVERRLRGMAAELAGALEDGAACQVCGSTDHPAPAAPTADAATREQQQAAQAAADRAREEHEQVRRRLTEAREHLVRLEQTAGGLHAEAAREAAGTAEQEVQQAVRAADEAPALAQQLSELESRIQDAGRSTERAEQQHEELGRRLAGLEQLAEETAPQVRAVLGASPSLDAALTEAREMLTSLQAAARAHARLEDAEEGHASCRRRAERSAAAAGFDELEQARAAVLSDEDVSGLESLLEQRRAARVRAQGVLDEADVRALDDVEGLPGDSDLDVVRAEAEAAATGLEEAVSRLRSAEEARAALVGVDDQVAAAVAAYTPARTEHEVAESMSRLVRGMGGDNHLQMRLSSYVLATRLDQVLDAADERLQQMRDNRYTFHRSSRARAGRRSGLDIEVLDDWTGDLRPPSSLSGGETFKLSLALALGLADVITHESGGLEIETLFIDEGFGMLDPDTLDEVMDCIDDLRSGGRAVGVVSHVTELRSRISTQLHVTPAREGSRVRLTTTTV
jgi:DNA repair protein SbcC/Rad50